MGADGAGVGASFGAARFEVVWRTEGAEVPVVAALPVVAFRLVPVVFSFLGASRFALVFSSAIFQLLFYPGPIPKVDQSSKYYFSGATRGSTSLVVRQDAGDTKHFTGSLFDERGEGMERVLHTGVNSMDANQAFILLLPCSRSVPAPQPSRSQRGLPSFCLVLSFDVPILTRR